MKIHHSDCLGILKIINANSVDSIVTDPPYGISVMNEKWDKCLPSQEIWKECFRALKPGGYILSFASARLYPHLALTMEKVGFQTQNMLAWLYGNGFPRGINVAKQLDRADALPRPDDKFRNYLRDAIKKSPYKVKDLEKMCDTVGMFSHYLGKNQSQFPSYEKWQILKKALKLDETYDTLFEKIEAHRKEFKLSEGGGNKSQHFKTLSKKFRKHKAKSELAKKWDGWQYGAMTLRPCIEPIYFGQKPPLRPMRENIVRYGVGALNMQNCKKSGRDGKERTASNVMYDGSDKVVVKLGQHSSTAVSSIGEFRPQLESPFFYVPKPSGSTRKVNTHPTVKPIDLMRHLVRLITPPRGTCLDPFMGSGTTGVACLMEGMDFIGIEREEEYFKIAQDRLEQLDLKVAIQ